MSTTDAEIAVGILWGTSLERAYRCTHYGNWVSTTRWDCGGATVDFDVCFNYVLILSHIGDVCNVVLGR